MKRGARAEIVGGVLLSGTYSLLAMFVSAVQGLCGLGGTEDEGGGGCGSAGDPPRGLVVGGAIVGLGSVGLFVHAGRRLHRVRAVTSPVAVVRPSLRPLVTSSANPVGPELTLVGLELSLVGRFH